MTTTQTTAQALDPKAIYETWEKAASSWFETWANSPAYLQAVGKTLEAQLGLKATADRFVENALEACRIPTAREVKSLGERLRSLEERMASIEEKRPGPKAS